MLNCCVVHRVTVAMRPPRVPEQLWQKPEANISYAASSTGSCHGTVSPDNTIDSWINNSDIDASTGIVLNFDVQDPFVPAPYKPEDFDVSTPGRASRARFRGPELRDTAKKYSRWSGRPEPQPVITESAMKNAFQDFTSGPQDESELPPTKSKAGSVEMNRAVNTRQRNSLKPVYGGTRASPTISMGGLRVGSTPKFGRTDGPLNVAAEELELKLQGKFKDLPQPSMSNAQNKPRKTSVKPTDDGDCNVIR